MATIMPIREYTYPALTAPTPTVTGCTKDSTVNGLSTFTAANPAELATTKRAIRPIFMVGRPGDLRWSVTVTPLAGVELTVYAQVLFTNDDGDQVGRWTGPSWTVDAGIVLSARLTVPRTGANAELQVISLCDTNSGQWTEYDTRLEQVVIAAEYVPPLRTDFGETSPEGVQAPAPPAGLPGGEANSPARRSPQVRYAQLIDSTRPDLLAKRNAREV